MKTRYFLVPAILGLAGLLFTTDAAFAQKGGGGRGGGGRGGASFSGAGRGASFSSAARGASFSSAARGANLSTARVGGASLAARSTSAYRGGAYYHNGNYYHNGYNYGSRYPGYGVGFGIGLFAPFFPSAYAWDGGVAPRVAFYSPTDEVQGQQSIPEAQPPQEAPKNAQINVLLPSPNAKVWFDGSPTTSTGTERLYHTPDLSTGATNTYRIRATWVANGKEITQERVVSVASGRGTVVDFTRAASEGVPLPRAKE